MPTTTNCPATEELQQILSGNVSGDRQQQCERHLDACPCCQAKLEELATGGTNLSQLVQRAGDDEPLATSAYWPALKALDGADQTPRAAQATATPPGGAPPGETPPALRRREASLSFLQPPTDAAYLGRLHHFDVMRVIGRGGMGLVLEAFDSKLQRNVALKVLDPELADDETARQRFCREARAAASITHENVVAVHQVERSEGERLPYLVMQLISGESLEQRLAREKKLPTREVVRIGMQAAQGLAAAHAQGLIHRDIKPGNILLEPPYDRVKLTDFGLARAAEDVKLTRTGFVSGTPLYMAPEQAMGEEPDPRSDLFSLGAILYEMSAGQPPFAGNSALAILKQIAETRPKPVRELNPAVPEWFAETIDGLLAKKPADRIQTAAHLAELLEFQWALLKTTSEDVPTVCAIEQRKRTIRNRIIAAAVAVTFLTVGLLGGMYFANRGATPGGSAATAAPELKSSAEPVAVLSAHSGAVWSVAFDRTSDTVAMAVEDGTVRLWDLPNKGVKSTYAAHRGVVWAARFTPDGKLLATAGDDGLIKLWDPAQAEPVKTYKHPNAVRGLAFSTDGHKIFAGDRDGGVRVWPIDGDAPLVESQQPGAVYAVALSPGGDALATAGTDKIVRLWNSATLTQKLPLEGNAGPIYGLSFNHDGKRLASVGWDRAVHIWDAGSGLLVKSWDGHGGDIWGVAYSPDGAKLATGGHDGAVKLWNAETGELLATYLGHEVAIHSLAFNPDGTLLASGGRDGAVRVWPVK